MPASILAPWLTEVAVVTYRALKQDKQGGAPLPISHLPVPSTYVSTFVVYGALSLFSGQTWAVLAAWGFVVATLLNLWTPGGTVAKSPAPTTKLGAPT